MGRIAVIGSCNVDLVVEAERWPKAGETIFGSRFSTLPGGKGANQAVAAARLGAEVAMVGCVGDDANGDLMKKVLAADGVQTDFIKTISGVTTGTAHITLAEGDNTIVVVPGANAAVDEAVIDGAWDFLKTCDMLLLQHEIPLATNEYILKKAKAAGVPVLLNPAPFEKLPAETLALASYVTPNEHEAALMFPGLSREEILTEAPCRVVMTVGARGVMYGEEGKAERVPGFSVPVVDTTGAGDTFNGAFAVAVSEGKPMREAVRFANAAAALSVGKLGAQGGMPRRAEVEAFLSCKK